MAKLSSEARKKLPKGDFAGPGRSFPVEDKDHAKAAILDASRDSKLSASEKKKIDSRAKAKLKKK